MTAPRDGSVQAMREEIRKAQQTADAAYLPIYEHVQIPAATLWTVNHNLGRWPSAVTVVTVGGVEVNAGVTHVSTAQLTIEFASPFAGRARII